MCRLAVPRFSSLRSMRWSPGYGHFSIILDRFSQGSLIEHLCSVIGRGVRFVVVDGAV